MHFHRFLWNSTDLVELQSVYWGTSRITSSICLVYLSLSICLLISDDQNKNEECSMKAPQIAVGLIVCPQYNSEQVCVKSCIITGVKKKEQY